LAVPGWHVSNFFPRSPLPEFAAPFSSRMYLLEPCRVGLVSNELAKFLFGFTLGSVLCAGSAGGRGHRAWGALLVPGSSCGMAAGPLFVARCQWPRAGQPCLLAPRALLHCRLWSRRVRTVPCPGQLWPPAYRVSWPATLSLRAVACRPWSMSWPSLRGQRVATRPPFPCPDRLPCLRRCLCGRVVWLVH
jgi:hypothetical protein